MLVFLFALIFSCSCDPSEVDVEVLTTDNFDSFIENDFVLVEFYAPWCGHCKKLVPEYAEAATTLKSSGSPVKLGKVDATVETSLGEKFAIRGYPTLKFFRGGKPVDYDGGRTAADIVQWVTKKSGPPSRRLSTQDEIKSVLSGSGTRTVAYITDEDQVSLWEEVAGGEKVQNFAFFHISDSSLFGENKEGTVELHKDGEDVIRYDGNFKASELTQWLLVEGFPLVDELSQDSWNRFTKSGLDLLAVFQKEKDNSIALSVAKAHKGDIIVTTSTQLEIATQWGSTGNVVPTAVYVSSAGGQPSFVVWNEESNVEFNAESLSTFVAGARDGSYETFIKSEPIPENNDGPVTILVGKNFDSIVKAGKDVLVEFYAPWCGHCKKLAPVFDELGEHFQNDANVVVAKMDATANGTPKGISIQGFPTLIFWNANNEQEAYSGERDLATLKKFIDSHRTSAPSTVEKQDL